MTTEHYILFTLIGLLVLFSALQIAGYVWGYYKNKGGEDNGTERKTSCGSEGTDEAVQHGCSAASEKDYSPERMGH
jgi:hypothetical protein